MNFTIIRAITLHVLLNSPLRWFVKGTGPVKSSVNVDSTYLRSKIENLV